MHNYYVYIMASAQNGTLYVGVTSDLVKRVFEHKHGLADGFTKRYGIKMLVWFKQTSEINAAIAQEKQIKKWYRKWKLELIERENPNWNDLYEQIIQSTNWIPAYAGMTKNKESL